MMKWGRKKPSSSSTSAVFPMSWLSRFKKTSGGSEPDKSANTTRKGKKGLSSPSLPPRANWNGGRFYSGDDDSYWTLSFREKSRGGLKSVWYDSEDELDVPLSGSQSFKAGAMEEAVTGERKKFGNKVSDGSKVRELPRHVEIMQGNYACKGKKHSRKAEYEVMRRKALKDRKSRKTSRRISAELERESHQADQNSTNAVHTIQTGRDNQKSTDLDSQRQRSRSFPNSNLRTIEEECAFEALNLEETNAFPEEASSKWQNFEDMEMEELKMKSEKQRKSVYINRESLKRRRKHGNKIECKIKALEGLKKAKMKMGKVAKERASKNTTAFDSFAVVKSSLDPEQDFRDSMVEMITDKGIGQPEELEELLACYLTLNCDEYHDLIIKVFRQVWLDLNQVQFDPELQFERCCNY